MRGERSAGAPPPPPPHPLLISFRVGGSVTSKYDIPRAYRQQFYTWLLPCSPPLQSLSILLRVRARTDLPIAVVFLAAFPVLEMEVAQVLHQALHVGQLLVTVQPPA